MSVTTLPGWDRLRHGGLLLDAPRLAELAAHAPPPLDAFTAFELRRRTSAVLDGDGEIAGYVAFVLGRVCGFDEEDATWLRGNAIPREWGRRSITGETVRPRQLWLGPNGAVLPVFFDSGRRLGIGRGRRSTSRVLAWLRAGTERLAVLTNGRQWRLIFAGLDYDAWCEWDVELWFEQGELSPQVHALRLLVQPRLWTPPEDGAPSPLLKAIQDSRKGQAELSAVLGERVRQAVELLIQGHAEALKERCPDVDPGDIYRAACRVVMRMVVILFAEARELLPRDNALYHAAYGLTGLMEELERTAARGGARLTRSWSAWPRVLALFSLVRRGSHHPELPVPAYGGALFAPGDPSASDGLSRALAVFENACFEAEAMADDHVHRMLDLLTRTSARIRQGRATTRVPVPVDFSDLSTEYIGILYEGLLDFELRTAPAGDPIIFLAVGDQPALPLSRLEAMDDRALRQLFERLNESNTTDSESAGQEADQPETAPEEELPTDEEDAPEAPPPGATSETDARHQTRTRAEDWARRAVAAAGLARRPRGRQTPERRLAYEDRVARAARRLVARVVLPGEWYLVRWGGTRKGAGTFYTRPGLAVPTVHRTLLPLAYEPPAARDGSPLREEPAARWTPKQPEEILALKICDPAAGSGTFLVAALRFLTEVLFASLHHHGRITPDGERSLVRLLGEGGSDTEALSDELVPCRPDDDSFEPRLKAVLRRHVVERCIYGVDIDPLGVELCRLSLWIETMDRTLPFSFLDHKIKCGNSLVGAWFDTFRHYPVMAFKNREGGDKNHTNGVHFAKDTRTRAIKAFVREKLTPDLKRFLTGATLFQEDLLERNIPVHDEALALLERLHGLPVRDAAERARLYRDELLGSGAWQSLKAAMDLWCACWFWPADHLESAPLPTTLADPPRETRAVASKLAARHRFFHWELEFPDVFRAPGAGFDAVLGNPPWDIAKPNSKEFFSNLDPLYRTYGKQEALRKQTEYFADESVERAWLDYNAAFRAQSNFCTYAAEPFGDPERHENSKDRFSLSRTRDQNATLHDRWRSARARSRGFADPAHPFRHQGSADLNLYKLFLEQAHALLRPGGRLGFVVPSGLYSDHGTRPLRQLFLERCRWEWLFGFENREKIFDIDSRYKFNPVIVEKGGRTGAIRTAFMRRELEDWERAEELAIPYTREQAERFSPKSLAILEIQSKRDLEILEKIYANSVLLGDDGPDGWGIQYAREFDMTNDSRLFPPRTWWEERGYRPDEYSRWIKGPWRPIAELWAELGVDPAQPVPAAIELQDWLFDTTAGPARRQAEARFLHGHLLKPGDVARTAWSLRCAQPPYDRLPIPRAHIPQGIILSREADAWIHEDRIEDMALPLYEGRMIGQFDFSPKGWVSGRGRSAVWRDIPWDRKVIQPQFLMSRTVFQDEVLRKYIATLAKVEGAEAAENEAKRLEKPDARAAWWLGQDSRCGFMDITSATNERTVIATKLPLRPAGNKVPVLATSQPFPLAASLSSLGIDFVARRRLTGLTLNFFILEEFALPQFTMVRSTLAQPSRSLAAPSYLFSVDWLRFDQSSSTTGIPAAWALSEAERVRIRSGIDTCILAILGLDLRSVTYVLEGTWEPDPGQQSLNPKGFWRVDRDRPPELRHTVLTLVAFHDLEEKIRAAGGDREEGIRAFLDQNHGEGWMLPETVRLADYGLGHDDRARHPQPVASRLGPRFYDWQLTQTPEESWQECHLHARNLLGEEGYRQLLTKLEKGEPEEPDDGCVAEPKAKYGEDAQQGRLFE